MADPPLVQIPQNLRKTNGHFEEPFNREPAREELLEGNPVEVLQDKGNLPFMIDHVEDLHDPVDLNALNKLTLMPEPGDLRRGRVLSPQGLDNDGPRLSLSAGPVHNGMQRLADLFYRGIAGKLSHDIRFLFVAGNDSCMELRGIRLRYRIRTYKKSPFN
ncbi:hypothetical protein ES708_12986 [subsurface metagenome]